MAGPAGGGGDHLIVATVRRPHGVRGDLLIAIETDRPVAVFRRRRLLEVGSPGGDPIGRSVAVNNYRPVPSGAILHLDGVDSREAAEAMRGATLLIPAGEAQPSAPGEVHYRELIGMVGRDGDLEIGTVEDILELPSGEILVLRSPAGKEILVPFVRDLVVRIDRRARQLRLKLPPGFLDL